MKNENAMSKNAAVRGRLIEVEGIVVSDKMQKTISVEVFRLVKHEKYGKYLRRSSIFKAHDEKAEARIGDKVKIVESKPLSKTKRWKLVAVIDQKVRGGQ
jgi:small subunit ribosomal protein S17